MCLATAWADEAAPATDYRPGSGWQIPGTGFNLGGYASVVFANDRQSPWRLSTDDLSLFIRWEGDSRWRLFSELDLEDPLSYTPDDGLTTRHAYLGLERLYADYSYSERVNVRLGKFLTPIGRWNTLHAAPLVWTTSRPLITERTFPTNATGAMLYGTVSAFAHEMDYAVYTALSEDWRPNPVLDPFEEAYGLRIMLPLSGLGEFGVSFANFEQRESVGERKNLLGMDYFRTIGRAEVSGEFAYRYSEDGRNADERGLFVQGVVPLRGRLYGVGRYEWYDPAGVAPGMNILVGGLALRLSPARVVKAEISHVTSNSIQMSDAVQMSFAILF